MSQRGVKLGEILGAAPEARGLHLVRILRTAADHLEFTLTSKPKLTATDIKLETLDELDEHQNPRFRITAHCVEEFDDTAEMLRDVALSIHDRSKR